MYYLSKEEILEACKKYKYIVLTKVYCGKVAINCKVAFLNYTQKRYNENTDGKTQYNGFYPCDFNEYISRKIPYYTQST